MMEMLRKKEGMGSLGHSNYSSDEENNSPQWITAQINVDSQYQSLTEKGIRCLCSQLLDMKMASAEELHSNVYSRCSEFVRISQELVDFERELIELKKHISTQGDLVHELTKGLYCEALSNEAWTVAAAEPRNLEDSSSFSNSNFCEEPSCSELETHTNSLSEILDVLLAEHKVEEALDVLDIEERVFAEVQKTEDISSSGVLLYQSIVTERKCRLAEQLVEIAEQPAVCRSELQKALSGLIRLGDGRRAHALLLRSYHSRLQNSIKSFVPNSVFISETYTTTLAQLVFSAISQAAKDSLAIFGESPEYVSELVLWAQKETKQFIQAVKKYVSFSEAGGGVRAACVCVQASVSLCSLLEIQGIKLCDYLIKLIRPYVEGVLEGNLKRVECFAANDDWILTSPVTDLSMDHGSHLPIAVGLKHHFKLTSSAHKFIIMVQDIVEDMTPLASVHFGGSILEGLACLFDSYINIFIKAIPCPTEDENSMDCKDNPNLFWAETEAQQLALLGNASALADELLPLSVSKILAKQIRNQENLFGTPKTSMLVISHLIKCKD